MSTKRNRLTNNADETEIASLLNTSGVFLIPYFQRAYMWKLDKIKQLQKDILNIVDDDDNHFLGAIIIHGRVSTPSQPKIYEVIDGQQRITTLYLLICAFVKFLCENGKPETAFGLFTEYLFLFKETNLISNFKLHPCKEDRTQLNMIMDEITKDKYIRDRLKAISYKTLPDGGPSKGALLNNYHAFLRFLKEQNEEDGFERIDSIINKALLSFSVVQIDVWDPTNGPKIFDSLNSQQQPMTIGDLVRNEIFSKVAENNNKVESVEKNYWQPFFMKFKDDKKNWFDDYFFPYGLIQHPNLTKSQVYSTLREDWDSLEPADIINNLSKYQDAFLLLKSGIDRMNLPKNASVMFRNLHDSGIPGSTLPFLMQLAVEIKDNNALLEEGNKILELVESFLVRRAVCGHEPTGLHAVFKRLWVDCENNLTSENVKEKIRDHKTVVCPTDYEFKTALIQRDLGSVGITPYILASFDKSLNGDELNYKGSWIEHVLPKKMSHSWYQCFTRDEHEEWHDTIGNLLLLSPEMNRDISNKSYAEKRIEYEVNSKYKSARELSRRYNTWDANCVKERGEEIANWALDRWKF